MRESSSNNSNSTTTTTTTTTTTHPEDDHLKGDERGNSSVLRELQLTEKDNVNSPTEDSDDDNDDHTHSISSLCAVAASIGSTIYGGSFSSSSSHDHQDHACWTSRALAPHRVSRLTCTADGTILVATTNAGTVSLLRGTDGTVLTTQTVVSASVENDNDMPCISWIPGGPDGTSTFLMEAPTSTNTYVLVTLYLFYGKTANDDYDNHHGDASAPTNRSQPFQMTPIQLSAPEQQPHLVLRAVSGAYLDADTIRLVACDADGCLVVFVYSLTSRTTTLVQDGIALTTRSNGGGETAPGAAQQHDGRLSEEYIDYEIGLIPQTIGAKTYFLCSAVGETSTTLYWFDPDSLTTACHYRFTAPPNDTSHNDTSRLSQYSNSHRPKIRAIQPIASSDPSETVSVAIAVSSSTAVGSLMTIHVLQVLTEEILSLMVLSQPHLLYSIPVNEPVTAVELAGRTTTESAAPFSFRFTYQTSTGTSVFKEFCPTADASRRLAHVRRLIEQAKFDEIDQRMTAEQVHAVLLQEFAAFHPLQLPLRKLQSLLAGGCLASEEALQQAHGCLQRLVQSAVRGEEQGLQQFFQAVDFVANALAQPTIRELHLVLSVLVSSVDDVYKALPTEHRKDVAEKKRALHNKLSAIKFLGSVVDGNERLAAPFHQVQSLSQLFNVLVQHGYFAVAELLWSTALKAKVSPERLVRPLLNIPATVHPKQYINLVNEVVFPTLSVSHELLGPVRAWACRTADDLDESDDSSLGLDAAIVLLEAVDKGNRALQMKIHSSFSVDCPFIDRKLSSFRSRRNVNTSNDSSRLSESLDTSVSVMSRSMMSSASRTKSTTTTSTVTTIKGARPAPTILELGALQQGATKATFGIIRPLADERYELADDCVEVKLRAARCLEHARREGLGKETITLRNFESEGGADTVAKRLIACVSQSVSDHDARKHLMEVNLHKFCASFAVSYDGAVLECVQEICSAKGVTKSAVDEAVSLTLCCSSPVMRSKAFLAVLRAALQCGYAPADIASLTSKALEWSACDSTLRSQVEEASRLLFIDGIVLKYCGPGARDIFRVDNPRHSSRLLEFVTQHIHHDLVLSDALALCDAFTHLDARHASAAIVQNAILQGEIERSTTIMKDIIARDQLLAERVLARIVLFIEEMMSENSLLIKQDCDNQGIVQDLQRKTNLACDCVVALITTLLEKKRYMSDVAAREINSFLRNNSLEGLKNDLQKVCQLQTRFSVFLSLSDLMEPKTVIAAVSNLVRPVVDAYAKSYIELLPSKIAIAKGACSILASEGKYTVTEIWVPACALAAVRMTQMHHDFAPVEFMESVGLFESSAEFVLARALISVAVAVCARASTAESPDQGMRCIVEAASLLHDRALACSDHCDLPGIVTLANVVGTIAEVLMATDEGKGEYLEKLRRDTQRQIWSRTKSPGLKQSLPCQELRTALHRPKLHTTWYVGDGLLLRPQDGLSHGLLFCKDLLKHLSTSAGVMGLFKCVRDSGSHYLALRVISASANHFLSSLERLTDNNIENVCEDLALGTLVTSKALALRCIGGSSRTGITSGIVDSQMAVSFLLALPQKQAFDIYKSSLPAARKLSDFKRVFTLANIGAIASDPNTLTRADNIFTFGWKNQEKFAKQCRSLARQSMWWVILRKFNVQFDSQRLGAKSSSPVDQSAAGKSQSTAGTSYAASLLPPLIAGLSQAMEHDDVLRLSAVFAEDFSLNFDLVVQSQIEFLLSAPHKAMTKTDPRCDLVRCESTVKKSLRMVRSSIERSAIVRKCLINLEKSRAIDTDYERFHLVLSLYYDTLVYIVDKDTRLRGLDMSPFESEIELIDRRRDALSILSSFFQGEHKKQRPAFPAFFLPLGPKVGEVESTSVVHSGILGRQAGAEDELFDPLQPLDAILSSTFGAAATPILASMCLSLGVPPGYIHVRYLMKRFESADDSHFPSFEEDVIPVVSRIRSKPNDRVEFLEWISKHYKNDDDKLKCLDLALSYAVEASTDVELRLSRSGNRDYLSEEIEGKALETVKRLSFAKSSLSDRLRVKAILRAAVDTNHGPIFDIVEQLVAELDKHVKDEMSTSPERLVDVLLTEGSLLIANASLADHIHFSTTKVRQIFTAVREASMALAEEHSHIDPARQAHKLAKNWLFFGDEKTLLTPREGSDEQSRPFSSVPAYAGPPDKDNTVDFEMDLDDVHAMDDDWETGEDTLKTESQVKRFTSDEEPSALKETSLREVSEHYCRRAGLRIAFVLAVASDCGQPEPTNNCENDLKSANRMASLESRRSRLLLKRDTKRDSTQDSKLMEISRTLIQIVFAQSNTGGLFGSDATSFELDDTETMVGMETNKIATFAMRYRALRAAAFLCPQEALEKVIDQDGLIATDSSMAAFALRDCTFAAFVAKEIEEMGLPLPHSDLRQLSTMHFASYARTLWRHHRDGYQKGHKGRLLILLLEMGLRNDPADANFIQSLLVEMVQTKLPRTLLAACERLSAYEDSKRSFDHVSVGKTLSTAFNAVAELILSELSRFALAESADHEEVYTALRSVKRLSAALVGSRHVDRIEEQFDRFSESVSEIAISTCNEELRFGLDTVVKNVKQCSKKMLILSAPRRDKNGKLGDNDCLGCKMSTSLGQLNDSLTSC